MIALENLPTLNALLNSLAAVLLLLGRRAVKKGDRESHKKIMLAAFGVSAVFLVSYLTYHYRYGHTVYDGQGILRPIYFSILIPHIILAMAMVPFVFAALWFAWKEQFSKHVKVVRWLWPVWLYVSFSGVAIYLMLYVF